jgi:hypothetical protein
MAGNLRNFNLPAPPPAMPRAAGGVGMAQSLARSAFGDLVGGDSYPEEGQEQQLPTTAEGRRELASDAFARRVGATIDEVGFPEFVASLVHGTFDAIVDSSIRQMEAYAELIAAVAKPSDQFTQENVSLNQAKDWLAQQFPADLALTRSANEWTMTVVPERNGGNDGDGFEEPRSPAWLADFGLAGEELTPELIEEQLVPRARDRVARDRLHTLASMVLLGMNRVVVRDGSISANLRFRAEAADHSKLDYAVSDDPPTGPGEWGRRGSRRYDLPSTKVSTVEVNAQSDSELIVSLSGQVRINFASETVPLDRFIDESRRMLLERHARPTAATGPARQIVAQPSAPTTTAPAPVPTSAQPAAPAPEQPAATTPPPAGPGGAQ